MFFIAPAAKLVEEDAWQGKPTGMALRVATIDDFLVDLTVELETTPS